MSKLSFRARALDAAKPMPVFRAEEIPDLPDFAAINRAVPQMPTGMEKEEESEHHLQRAISAQQAYGHTGELVIPTPDVFNAPDVIYNDLYPSNYKLPRQLIHVQPFAIEHDIPDYDMDSEDESWLTRQSQDMDVSQLKFEEIIERLEKSSGQHVVTLNEAKVLLKEDDDLVIAIYDYWLNKRLSTQHPLVHQVKTERRDGTTNNNPYVAFRRRTEKMQTRKNRKNDEASYEKMLKLRRDLSRAVNLLELVKHREKSKHEHLKLTIDIFDKRYHIGDYSGQILADLQALRHAKQPSFFPPGSAQAKGFDKNRAKAGESSAPKRRREYKRRKADSTAHRPGHEFTFSSDDETAASGTAHPASDQEEEDPDGPYAFKRKQGCMYHSALTEQYGNWPWEPPEEGGLGDKKYRFCLTQISQPRPRYVGFARRRIGRGGRIILDRTWSHLDSFLTELDTPGPDNVLPDDIADEISKEWTQFRPKTPPPQYDDGSGTNDSNFGEESETTIAEDGSLIPVVHLTALTEILADDMEPSTSAETDLGNFNFRSHQEELHEMQRSQHIERLKQQGQEESGGTESRDHLSAQHSSLPSAMASSGSSSGAGGASSSEAVSVMISSNPASHPSDPTLWNSCKSSSSPWSHNVHTIITPSLKQPKTSTLDSESAQFAVTAVLSASEVRTTPHERPDRSRGSSLFQFTSV